MSKRELSISEQCQKIITQVHQDDLDESFGLIKKAERAEPLLSSEGLREARNKNKETPEHTKQRAQNDLNERAGYKTGDLKESTPCQQRVTKKDQGIITKRLFEFYHE